MISTVGGGDFMVARSLRPRAYYLLSIWRKCSGRFLANPPAQKTIRAGGWKDLAPAQHQQLVSGILVNEHALLSLEMMPAATSFKSSCASRLAIVSRESASFFVFFFMKSSLSRRADSERPS